MKMALLLKIWLVGFVSVDYTHSNPDAVYEKLPSRNVMSPRKALNELLLQRLQNMREPQSAEEAVPKQGQEGKARS